MKKTSNKPDIEKEFFKVWEQTEFKCDTCEFSKMYARTRDLFAVRHADYLNTFEKIAQIINPGLGMCGKIHNDLPEMLEKWLDTRGDKAKIISENKRLLKENQELALEVNRLRKGTGV